MGWALGYNGGPQGWSICEGDVFCPGEKVLRYQRGE